MFTVDETGFFGSSVLVFYKGKQNYNFSAP